MQSSSTQPPLERGRACARCRRRKMRCDGQRPACGQCERADRAEDCEYQDGNSPTQNQLLEDQVADLERRIAHINAGRDPIVLHDPYHTWNAAQRSAQNDHDPMRALVRQFTQHATEFGFFLHIHRFLDKVFLQSNSTHSNSLRILLNVIYLIGAKLSGNPQVKAQERAYLDRALQHLPTALPEDPRGAIYVMQAEVLLANYFFDSDRKLEGVYHTNAAVSIAVASRLHTIRSARRSRSTTDAATYRLPPPVDLLEEGERINGFWTVFVLDRCWAVATGSAPAFTDSESAGTQIDTPWPMELAAYQSHPFPNEFRSMRTVQSFISGAESDANVAHQSILAMHAKAAILYEGATRLASRYNPSSQATFLSLDNRIESFKRALPRIDPARVDILRPALLVHTLANCASIQLHAPLVQDRVTANSRTYQAAHAAVRSLREIEGGVLFCVNPFAGILWSSIGRVILQGLSTARQMRAAGATVAQGLPDEGTLQSEMARLTAAMGQSAPFSPFMSSQIRPLRPGRPAA
ncbi:uncharacterized protein TRAVEDRAFT_47347 [Trametes versicolor FP-101664 SS1]|uniref:uncharacterized protein n=1 Tax=Trametes versicolor (strain FP-101664) TaxID=717944 RepID=UPI00046233F4|nr:uncharacterized protein TRAVEDRAFT_47347 [Trametes versicolor FP-101664 SS1]EIW58174.1 hypothetical protein TRAVEDRAFT_47347 [Trametes versicolor FP-101664 SS1]